MMNDNNRPKININIKTPEDYRNNLYLYLNCCLVILCEDLDIPVPPLILTVESPHSQNMVDTDIIYINIKEDDYVGMLIHEVGHYMGLDEWDAIKFTYDIRDDFQSNFNMNIMT